MGTRKLIDMLPILFSGTVNGHMYFCEQTGLKPKDVKRINNLDDLRGYQNKIWFYGPGYQWLPKDKSVFEYTATHGIHLIAWPESAFCFEFMWLVRNEYRR